MFKQISEMLEVGSALVLSVAKEKDGKLCVQVRPVGEFKNPALGQGITFTDQAEVIDAEFAQTLASYGPAHKSLREQVEDRVRVMEAAAQAEKELKADAIKKGAGRVATKTAAAGMVPKKGVAGEGGVASPGAEGGGAEDASAEAGGELQLF
jgi:PRTRC genetic system protein E